MQRYHKAICFPICNEKILKDFVNSISCLQYRPSKHCIDNIKGRFLESLEKISSKIKAYEPIYEDIFEYYISDNKIDKVCFRFNFSENYDIILVLSDQKDIITIYINSVSDGHETLKENLYSKE